MVLSQLSPQEVRQYGRIDTDYFDDALIEALISAASAFCLSYTGLTAEEADQYEDIALAATVIAVDMYDNRSMIVDKDTVNPTVSAILGLHSRNLL